MNQHNRLVTLLIVPLLLLAACSSAVPEPEALPAVERDMVIIGYSAPGLVGGQLQIQQSLEQHARDKGWQLITTTSNGDPAKQVEQIAGFVDLGVDAIVAVPDDSRQICEAVEQSQAADIPFYTIDRAPEGCAINMTVLSDNFMAGRQSGEAMVQLLTERYGEARGTVLEITGNMAHDVAHMRGDGFHAALADYPEVEVITKVGDWQSKQGAALVTEALEVGTEIDGIYLHSDAVYCDAVIAALEEQGQLYARGEAGHIFLTGVDGSQAGVQAIRDGFADQVSNQPIPDFGIVVDWIEKELQGEAISAGEVVRDGALWSPAEVRESPEGLQLFLSTTSVTIDNVDHPGLWANQ
jgi:ABC-type sugar transport system substrate-binding protein